MYIFYYLFLPILCTLRTTSTVAFLFALESFLAWPCRLALLLATLPLALFRFIPRIPETSTAPLLHYQQNPRPCETLQPFHCNLVLVTYIDVSSDCSLWWLIKVCFLYSAVSSPLDRSKRFTLCPPPSRPVHSDTNSTSLQSFLATQQLRAKTIHSHLYHRL